MNGWMHGWVIDILNYTFNNTDCCILVKSYGLDTVGQESVWYWAASSYRNLRILFATYAFAVHIWTCTKASDVHSYECTKLRMHTYTNTNPQIPTNECKYNALPHL